MQSCGAGRGERVELCLFCDRLVVMETLGVLSGRLRRLWAVSLGSALLRFGAFWRWGLSKILGLGRRLWVRIPAGAVFFWFFDLGSSSGLLGIFAEFLVCLKASQNGSCAPSVVLRVAFGRVPESKGGWTWGMVTSSCSLRKFGWQTIPRTNVLSAGPAAPDRRLSSLFSAKAGVPVMQCRLVCVMVR
ncbi:unnamed protein product [Phaeothamnion confervicola]